MIKNFLASMATMCEVQVVFYELILRYRSCMCVCVNKKSYKYKLRPFNSYLKIWHRLFGILVDAKRFSKYTRRLLNLFYRRMQISVLSPVIVLTTTHLFGSLMLRPAGDIKQLFLEMSRPLLSIPFGS